MNGDQGPRCGDGGEDLKGGEGGGGRGLVRRGGGKRQRQVGRVVDY